MAQTKGLSRKNLKGELMEFKNRVFYSTGLSCKDSKGGFYGTNL